MNPHWYLVKRNWPQTKARFPFPNYAGIGGEVWPFDSDGTTDKELRDLHSRMEQSRTIVDFGSHTRFVCTNAKIAEEYFTATKKHCQKAWLIRVALPQAEAAQISGYDIGFADGGFSVIETELITQGLPGPSLNEWGLIQTLPEAIAYFEARKENKALEQLDEIEVVSINLIRHS